MRALGIALLAFALTSIALVPLADDAAADHVYTHRYQIQGRVVDDAGDPVSQARVSVQLDDWLIQEEGVSGLCRQGGAQRVSEDTWVTATSGVGDYQLCIHSHQLIDVGQVVISVGNESKTLEKDLDTRTAYAHIVIPEGSAGQKGNTAQFASQVRVSGKLWQPLGDERNIEGNTATGTTPSALKITATLELANGTTLTEETQPNQWGDFHAVFQTSADLEGAEVTLKAGPGTEAYTKTVTVDPMFRAHDEVFFITEELDTADSPGPGLALVGLAILAAVAVATRMRRR